MQLKYLPNTLTQVLETPCLDALHSLTHSYLSIIIPFWIPTSNIYLWWMPETPLPTPNSVVTTTCVVPYLQNKRSSCSMLFICLSNLPNSFRSHQQATGERDSLQSTVAPMKTFWYPHMITTLLQLVLCVCVCPFLDCIFTYMYVNFTPKTIKQSGAIYLNLQSPERCRKNNNRCVFPSDRHQNARSSGQGSLHSKLLQIVWRFNLLLVVFELHSSRRPSTIHRCLSTSRAYPRASGKSVSKTKQLRRLADVPAVFMLL